MENNRMEAPLAQANGGINAGDWWNEVSQAGRERIVDKIYDTVRRNLPFSGQGELPEVREIAESYEQGVYAGATSQYAYLSEISKKILAYEMIGNIGQNLSDQGDDDGGEVVNLLRVPLDNLCWEEISE